MTPLRILTLLLLLTTTLTHAESPLPIGVIRLPVTFSGGHDTDPQDRGRPVILIAGALGISPEVFRDAFSRVHPADPGKGPTGDEARKNKAALMGALGKHGVTNDRLDEVSNYYRYVRSRGELWPTTPAKANALVKNGAVIGYELLAGGSGYTSPPTLSIPNLPSAPARIELSFTKPFETNGSIKSISPNK